MTPYRISLHERPPREDVPRSAIRLLQAMGALFGIACVACVAAISLFGARDVTAAWIAGGKITTGVAVILPLVLVGVGMRSMAGTRTRFVAHGSAIAWIAALVGERALDAKIVGCSDGAVVESSIASIAVVEILRVLALAGIALVPCLAARGRVIARWPLFATIGLAVGELAERMRVVSFVRYLQPVFTPSWTMIVLLALLAYTYLTAARELRDESFAMRAARFPSALGTLFPSPEDRAAFLGPARLANDAIVALAVLSATESTSRLAYSRSFRLDAPPTSVGVAALLLVVLVSLFWIKRVSNEGSYAPIVGAFSAAVAAIYSASFDSGPAGSVALLLASTAIVGLVVVAPRTATPTRAMKRWVSFISATGVQVGATGFIALTVNSHGEPVLSRLGKLSAVVFAIIAATALTKLELHARVELVAEEREP